MPDIRYIILSDMHLGQDLSILTNILEQPGGHLHRHLQVDPEASAPALIHMVDILARLISHNQDSEPPVLILLGDIIELVLTETHVSTPVFERFVNLWQRDGRLLFSKVIFLAGSHDHQLWEGARAAAYAEYLAQAPPFERPRPARHTTSMVSGLPGGDRLLRALVTRALGKDRLEVETYYPNLALRSPSGKRIALLHHGHYAMPLYRVMSSLAGKLFPEQAPLPPEVEEWEKENFAWIDFFWSIQGRSGVVGSEVERIYDTLSDERKLEPLSRQLARSLSDSWRPGSRVGKAERAVLDKILPHMFGWLVSRLAPERAQATPAELPSESWLESLRVYADGPLINQAHDELGPLPDQVSLIVGHTHQPFECVWNGGLLGDAVELYNTGGWAVAPSPTLQPHMGGAAVLLDRELNAASVRFFNQAEDTSQYRVRLASARTENNPLYQRLAPLIDPTGDPCAAFSRAAAASIEHRFEVIRHVDNGPFPAARS